MARELAWLTPDTEDLFSPLRAPKRQALILLHVDDLLVVGDYSFIELQLLPVLKEKYKLSMEVMKEPGDEVNL